MSSTLALSALLARLSTDELSTLVATRRVANPDSISDPLGLAIEYLRAESIQRALPRLHREALNALQVTSPEHYSSQQTNELRAHALIGWDDRTESFVPLPEVVAAASAALTAAGVAAEALTQTAPDIARHEATPTAGVPGAPAAWSGQAVAAVRVTAALLQVLEAEPAKMNRKGVVTAATLKSLAEQLHADVDFIADLLSALEWAGLATPVAESADRTAPRRLTLTAAAQIWREHPYPERWVQLAEGLERECTPEMILALQSAPGQLGFAVGTLLPHEFPLLTEAARQHAERVARTAESLGVTVTGAVMPPFAALLQRDNVAARQLATHDFPEPAPGVYLQPDLTLIAPGPLLPQVELTLFVVTEVDQLGAAAVLRFTERSLARAIRAGFTAETLQSFLAEISLTGIPQPLTFMLNDLERERPKLHQSATHGNNWFAQQLAQRVANATPNAETTASVAPVADTVAPSDLEQLVSRVHAAAQRDPNTGDLSRVIELAIRDRSILCVTAAAGSEQRSFTLLPLAVTAGRLRATDQVAEVERTLPLTAIIAAVPA